MTDPLKEKFGENAKSFTIIVPAGNPYSDPKVATRIADDLQQRGLNAELISDGGLPTQDEHGAYTLVTKDNEAERMAPMILDSHYQLIPIQN